MAEDTVKLDIDKYRLLVAVRYLNAADSLYSGLKTQQGKNDFHFVVTTRSFIEYTRRGIWFLAFASEKKLMDAGKVTFDRPGSPSLADMDKEINAALGRGHISHLLDPVPPIDNEPFINCLHALTHGNPISVRMFGFGMDKMFQTGKMLLRAETDLHLFRILLYRRMLGEKLKDIWKMLSTIHGQPDTMRTNAKNAALQVKAAGLLDWPGA
jgi:hypothetical protein